MSYHIITLQTVERRIYILNIAYIYIYTYIYVYIEVRQDFQFDQGVSIFCVLHVWRCSNPSRCRYCIYLFKTISDINTHTHI